MSPGLSGSAAVGLGGASPPVAAGPLVGRIRTPGEAEVVSAKGGREPGPKAPIKHGGAKNERGATDNQERHL